MLVGRRSELHRIGALLGEARRGRGDALVIIGEPGIGKTALLAEAIHLAKGCSIARASAVETEARLPFAALSEVAEPLLSGIDALPPPQASALGAALTIVPVPGGPGDRLAIFAGFLGLVREAAAANPLLILIDDAHWLDASSAECLGFVARRLEGTRAAMIVAGREGEELKGFESAGVTRLAINGLDRASAVELLDRRSVQMSRRAVDAVVDASAGNPLALIELPAMLSDAQRHGAAPLDPLPAPAGALAEAFERRVELAGEEARAALVVAGASFGRALAPVVCATRELGIGVEALERAEAEGLLELTTDSLVFAHPLLRGVAYGAATPAERRRAHAALARHTDADARAWHLAAAAIGPDAEAVGELVGAATRATTRGAHGAAADAFERAAALSEGPGRAPFLFAGGLAAAMGGDYDRGTALLEHAGESEDATTRTAARHLQAMVGLTGGVREVRSNHATLNAEAERALESDPAAAAMLFADCGVIAVVAGDCVLALASAERANEVLTAQAPPPKRCQARSILGMALALRGRTAEATIALDEAGAMLEHVDPLSPAAQSILFALGARLCTGQEELLLSEARGLAHAARENRSLGLLPYFQLQAADSVYRLGGWDDAQGYADEAIANAELSGQGGPLSIALVISGRIRAARGEAEVARGEIERGMSLAEAPGYGSTAIWARAALGFLELGRGDAHTAIAELEEARRLALDAGLEDPVIVPWASDLIEAYVRAGWRSEATGEADDLDARAERSGLAAARGLAARCRGLVSEGEFAGHFDRALSHHREAGLPMEFARTLFAYGSRLHRGRQRVDARKRLREARDRFDELGAVPWAERVSAELEAAGAVERRRFSDPDELTAQEIRVALAVARGAKNREVAAELFLSPKTIEFHLGRVYRKLGIHSRTELATMVAEGRLGQPGRS